MEDDELDGDGDGYMGCEGDCDDTNDLVNPGAVEHCDGLDNDCSGAPEADEVDGDGDGFMGCDGDCDDAEPAAFPGNTEVCDGIDNNCLGGPAPNEVDDDNDGYMECEGDCDDTSDLVNPGALEACDGVDNDCDTFVDEPDATDCTTYWRDLDGDGYGDETSSRCLCAPQAPHDAENDDDCFDYNANAFPGNTAWFDLHRGDGSCDYNCDGVESALYEDLGSCSDVSGTCTLVEGWNLTVPSCANPGLWLDSCAGEDGDCEFTGTPRTQECQ